jgi:two-component sensor histidine kinase
MLIPRWLLVPKSRWRPTLSVRQYFALITLWAVIPWIGLALYVGERVAQNARESLRAALVSSAHSLAAAVDGEIDKHIAVATTLTHSTALLAGDWAAFRDQAKQSLGFLPGSGLIVADPNGRQFLNLSTAPDMPLPARPAELQASQQQAFATGRPQVSDIYVGRNSRVPLVSVEAPVLRGGAPLYALAVRLDPGVFRKLLEEQRLPANWYAAIVDRKGAFVARLPDPYGSLTGQPVSGSWRRSMEDTPEGLMESPTVEGIQLVSAYTRTAHGWTAGIGIAKSALEAPVWQTRALLAIVGVGCVGLSFLLAHALAKKFDAATCALKDAANAIAQAHPVAAPAGTGIREYDELGTALGSTSSLLQARSAERQGAEQALARRVDELAAIYEFTEKRFRATSVADICDAALDAIMHALHCGRAAIQQYDTGVMRFAAWRGLSQRYRAAIEGHSPWRPDDKEPRPVLVADVDRAPERLEPLRDTLKEEGIRALAFFPVVAEGRLIGKLVAYYDIPHVFTDEEVKTATNIALRLGFAIEHKRADEAREIARRELQHRCNNLLAVVQGIAQKTLSGAPSLAEARGSFDSRLRALARAHRQLVQSNWTGVSLEEIVRLAMEPFVSRSDIVGEDIMLAPKDAQNFSLAVHELATNAVKYGALSSIGGKISIAWAVAEADGERVLKFLWQERGGPQVMVPSRRGFGTSLLKATFGRVQFDYDSAGLMCEIDARLAALAPAGALPL